MNTRNRSLLAVALGTILIAPLAAAQSPQSNATARAKVQQDTVQHDAMQHDNKNALPPQVNPEEVLEQSVDPRVPTGDVADDALGAASSVPARRPVPGTMRSTTSMTATTTARRTGTITTKRSNRIR